MKNVDQNFTITFQTVMIWYFLLWLSPEFSKDNVAKVKLGCGLGSMVRNSLFGFFNIQTYCIQVENWSCIILNGTFEYLSLLNWYSLNLYQYCIYSLFALISVYMYRHRAVFHLLFSVFPSSQERKMFYNHFCSSNIPLSLNLLCWSVS